MKHDSFNESVEMYLKTVCELAVGGNPVPISVLAGRLGVSPVSATEMIHRLVNHGLVDHRPYKGIVLTSQGASRANGIIRSHRLWECFLADELGLPWDEVHGFACRLEHATDSRVTDALDEFLGHPAACPHGNPIPDIAGVVIEPATRPLIDLQPGDTAVIGKIRPESDDLLAYLGEMGLLTGTQIIVREKVPFGGPLVIQSGGDIRYLGQEAATKIFVRLIEETE